jgi:hypothetical protein
LHTNYPIVYTAAYATGQQLLDLLAQRQSANRLKSIDSVVLQEDLPSMPDSEAKQERDVEYQIEYARDKKVKGERADQFHADLVKEAAADFDWECRSLDEYAQGALKRRHMCTVDEEETEEEEMEK